MFPQQYLMVVSAHILCILWRSSEMGFASSNSISQCRCYSLQPKFHMARHILTRHVRHVETSVSSRVVRQARHNQNAWRNATWRDDSSGIWAYQALRQVLHEDRRPQMPRPVCGFILQPHARRKAIVLLGSMLLYYTAINHKLCFIYVYVCFYGFENYKFFKRKCDSVVI